MKYIGEVTYFFGIRIFRYRNSRLLYLDQEKYLDKVFKMFNIQNCKALSTPIYKIQSLSKAMCPRNEEQLQEMKNFPNA